VVDHDRPDGLAGREPGLAGVRIADPRIEPPADTKTDRLIFQRALSTFE
jgi:hypothetical protein